MIGFLSSRGFPAVHSGVLTVLCLCAFEKAQTRQAFDEITVHRINIVPLTGLRATAQRHGGTGPYRLASRPHGAPKIQLLDADGKVTSEIPSALK